MAEQNPNPAKMQKSELARLLERTILEYMRKEAASFSERAKVYSAIAEETIILEDIKEARALTHASKKVAVTETLERLVKEKTERLNEIQIIQKKPKQELDLSVLIHHSKGILDIVLPLNYEERETMGLPSRLYKSIISALHEPEIINYSGLTIISAHPKNRNKVVREIEAIANEADFKEADVQFHVDEFASLLEMKAAKPQIAPEIIEKAIIEGEKTYTSKDVNKAVGYADKTSSSRLVRRYFELKGIKGVGKRVAYKLTQEQLDEIVALGKSGKEKRKATRAERKYTVKDVQETLGVGYSNALRMVERYATHHKVRRKGRQYNLSESEFNELTNKKTIQPELRRQINSDIASGMSCEEIFNKYRGQYKDLPKSFRGAINLMYASYKRKRK